MKHLPTKDDLLQAKARVQPLIHFTPILESQQINRRLGVRCLFKSEHLQKTGSFKVRGALNALQLLSEDERQLGVITHSSGNHGQALAWAGGMMHTKVHVVVPQDAPRVKVEAMQQYGAHIHFCAPGQAARESMCHALIEANGFAFIAPYDDYRIIAGQSTMMQECLEQAPDLDAAFVPVGGGGLLGGSLLAKKYFRSDLPVYGAEPEQADDAFRSWQSGVRQAQLAPHTMADGLRTALGERNFPIIQAEAAGIVTVSEAAIAEAMGWVFTYLKQAIEPSAAVSLAAIAKERDHWQGKTVLSILCGGNADFNRWVNPQ